MSQSHRDLAARWFEEVWNQRRDETIDELLCPECRGHMEGLDEARAEDFKQMRRQLLAALPDLRITVEDVVSDDRAAVVRWRAEGTAGKGAAASNGPVTFSGMTWLELEDGRIVEAWDRWNRDALAKRLGF